MNICKLLLLPLQAICKDFGNISYENPSLQDITYPSFILQDYKWLKAIYFLTTIAFWLHTQSVLLCVVSITQISHYGKLMTLHKLISFALELTSQIKQNSPLRNHAVPGLFFKNYSGDEFSIFFTFLWQSLWVY